MPSSHSKPPNAHAPRFAADIAHRDQEIESCLAVVGRWNAKRAMHAATVGGAA